MNPRAHYTKRTGNLICEEIAMGKTLQEALDKVGYLAPTIPVFWKWLEQFPDFRDQYERARQLSADMTADRLKEIGKEVISNPKSAAAYQVAMRVLQWEAEIRNPGRYGKKHESKGKNPMDASKLRAEIKRLEKELGIVESKVVPLKKVEG